MEQMQKTVQSLMDDAVAKGNIAGANLLVLQKGQEIVYAEAGYGDREKKRPYRRDTIARLYSMTKPVTAAAVMILVERGLLDLGSGLSSILPCFANPMVWEQGKKVPARREITVKDLLNMTSGLPYPAEGEAGRAAAEMFEEVYARLYTDDPVTTMEMAEKLAQGGLHFHPGDHWMYGTSADILGAVVEAVSGMKFGEFLRKELFEPLGMDDTGFYVPEEKQHRLAEAYECTAEGIRHFQTNYLGIRYPMDCPPAFESGGAGLVSTLDDYAKFATMLMEGGRGILKPNTVRFLTEGALTDWQKESCQRNWNDLIGQTYGNLMRHMTEPARAVYHGWAGEYGWDGWLGCYFCNCPEKGITFLFTCQIKDCAVLPLIRRIRNVIAATL